MRLSMAILAALTTVLAGPAARAQGESDPKINLHEPPFIVMSHYEVSGVLHDQQIAYARALMKHLASLTTVSKIPFSGLTREKILEKMKSEDEWTRFMIDVYKACAKTGNKAACDRIEQDRLDVFGMSSRQSEEDRKAGAKPHSNSQPTTLPPSK